MIRERKASASKERNAPSLFATRSASSNDTQQPPDKRRLIREFTTAPSRLWKLVPDATRAGSYAVEHRWYRDIGRGDEVTMLDGNRYPRQDTQHFGMTYGEPPGPDVNDKCPWKRSEHVERTRMYDTGRPWQSTTLKSRRTVGAIEGDRNMGAIPVLPSSESLYRVEIRLRHA